MLKRMIVRIWFFACGLNLLILRNRWIHSDQVLWRSSSPLKRMDHHHCYRLLSLRTNALSPSTVNFSDTLNAAEDFAIKEPSLAPDSSGGAFDVEGDADPAADDG